MHRTLVRLRHFSSSSSSSFQKQPQQQQQSALRVAIVGGGGAGLSAALHLCPLVDRGIIHGPIHLYESSSLEKQEEEDVSVLQDRTFPKEECLESSISSESSSLVVEKKKKKKKTLYSRGSGAIGRDVGVGIWSTALHPFGTPRPSHQKLLQRLIDHGHFVRDVGYRTPDGTWLTQSKLAGCPFAATTTTNISPQITNTTTTTTMRSDIRLQQTHHDPALLFVQENELLSALRDSVFMEEEEEKESTNTNDPTIQTFYNQTVEHIICDDEPTTNTNVDSKITSSMQDISGGRLVFQDGTQSESKYHLILAAGGMHSKLRRRYSRHLEHFGGDGVFVHRDALQHDDDDDDEEEDVPPPDLEDRGYNVFRGNSCLSKFNQDRMSFQTWGKGNSMRFATVPVPLLSNNSSNHNNNNNSNKSTDNLGQVWFVTTDDKSITTSSNNPVEQKESLLKAFSKWHDPICDLIRSTPAEDILMERAVAHRHSAARLGGHFYKVSGSSSKTHHHHHHHHVKEEDEPILCFIGDADMTVDPVLAQGFTIAMEDGADVANCVEETFDKLVSQPTNNNNNTTNHRPQEQQSVALIEALRNEFEERYARKQHRLVCLLRATELVQTLSQPKSGTVLGVLASSVVRPITKYVTPEFVKKHVFDWMMRYSLGMIAKEKVNSDGGGGGNMK